jgi:MFS family permease
MRRLLRGRDVRLYIVGQVFSMFGDSCLWLAMGIWVKTLTASNAAAGLTFFFFSAPTLLAPASGLLADRVRRRPLLVATNTFAAGAVLLLLSVHDADQVWLVYVVMALYGLVYSLLGSAQSALLTVMVPADLLPDANAALRTIQESLRLVGPLTGAALFVAVGAHTIAIIDAATFAVPVVCLLALRVREAAPMPRESSWRDELTAGVRHVYRTVALRQVVIAGALSTAVFGFAETITYAIASGLHHRPAFVGVLVAIQGVGALIGGPTAAALVRRIGEHRLIALALLTAAAGAVLQTPPLLAPVIAGYILLGAAIPWLVVALISLTQRLTPSALQGRAYAAVDTLITVPQTISIALGAGLIAITGYRPLLIAMAAVMSAAAAYLLTRKDHLRSATSPFRKREQRRRDQGRRSAGEIRHSLSPPEARVQPRRADSPRRKRHDGAQSS